MSELEWKQIVNPEERHSDLAGILQVIVHGITIVKWIGGGVILALGFFMMQYLQQRDLVNENRNIRTELARMTSRMESFERIAYRTQVMWMGGGWEEKISHPLQDVKVHPHR